VARFQFRKKADADPTGFGNTEPGSDGSAAVLAARFGLRRTMADDGPVEAGGTGGVWSRLKRLRTKRADGTAPTFVELDDPVDQGRDGRRRVGAFAIALGTTVLASAGLLVWLAVTAEGTVARLRPAPPLVVPVLLPDGTPRFAEPVPDAPVEEAAVDPVDIPVQLAPSRADMLLEKTAAGLLPRVAEDGTKPWQYYARPFPQDDARPRIAIVMTDLGLSATATDNAIDRLPGAVTFAFVPGVSGLQAMIDRARTDGHEALLTVPMEPVGYPRNDPGPGTLLLEFSDERNRERLHGAMAAATGYVGLTSTTGTAFLSRAANLQPVLAEVHRRGLVFVDARPVADSQATRLASQLGLPRAVSDVLIDRVASSAGIDAQLKELERLALANGAAVGYAQTYPVTVERLATWAAGLREKGIVLAPVTAVVNRQADR